MWPNTIIEQESETLLQSLIGAVQNADQYFHNYKEVKTYLCKEIYPNIGRIEPNLSDHGQDHIQDVLFNAYTLLKNFFDAETIGNEKYSPIELYVLCMAVLIHDIGNIHGREGHEKLITTIFNPTNFPHIPRSEMKIIIDIAIAHGGEGDTLSKLSSQQILGYEIKSPEIGAIVRFSDELAEGPQRTSQYMIEKGLITEESLPYHQYASILQKPAIFQKNIQLTYNIVVNEYTAAELETLLKITFKRIEKLNFERIYCGQYSEYIQKLKKVIVQMIFYAEKDSFDPIEVDPKFTELELTNLECHGLNAEKKNDYIEQILLITTPFCKE